jgi:hypothetical protein
MLVLTPGQLRPTLRTLGAPCLIERLPRHEQQRNGAMTEGSKHVEQRRELNGPIAVGLGVLGCGQECSRRKKDGEQHHSVGRRALWSW